MLKSTTQAEYQCCPFSRPSQGASDGDTKKDMKRISLAQAYRFSDLLEKQVSLSLDQAVIPPLCKDILDVCRFIYAIDCKNRRPRNGNQWGRKFILTLPVRVIEVWHRPEIATLLSKLMYTLGSDEWIINFVASNVREEVEQLSLFPLPLSYSSENVHVCLLSEGLDSVSGLIQQVDSLRAKHEDASFIAVTALMQTQVRHRVERVVKSTNKAWPASVTSVYAPLYRSTKRSRSHEESEGDKDEPSQRTRSLLLLGLAAAVAITAGQHKVEIFENGVEMFNFPLSPIMSNERYSKAMYPVVLTQMAAFLSELTGEIFEFSTPFAFNTKGDLLQAAVPLLPQEAINKTVSCMHWPQRRLGGTLCGTCAGCLLRRVAFAKAGMIDPATSLYRTDIFSDEAFRTPLAERDWPLRQDNDPAPEWDPLFQMDLRLFRLGSALSKVSKKREFRRLTGLTLPMEDELFRAVARLTGVDRESVPDLVLDMMRRYDAEWRAVRDNIPALIRVRTQFTRGGGTSQTTSTKSVVQSKYKMGRLQS